MSFNIVLVEPEIPQNTGNIARTCAVTGSKLHLVKPLGFSLDEKQARRAGLDYWQYAEHIEYESLDEFFSKNVGGDFYFASTKARVKYSDVTYSNNAFILFGKETKGLPEDLIFNNLKKAIKIPMDSTTRSLNLSNAVAIVVYEALRQNDFFDLK